MDKESYFSLQHSESVVATMAATIFSAYVRNGVVTEANENAYVERAVEAAVKLALLADKQVKSDSEWMPQDKAGPML